LVVSGDAVVAADCPVIVVSDVDIGIGDVVAVIVISCSLGAKTTNCNTREMVTANIIRTMKDMPIILTR